MYFLEQGAAISVKTWNRMPRRKCHTNNPSEVSPNMCQCHFLLWGLSHSERCHSELQYFLKWFKAERAQKSCFPICDPSLTFDYFGCLNSIQI
jgi:hypothetical protein